VSTEIGAVLELLREHAVALAAAGPHPPGRVRVEAAGAAIELGWADVPSGPPVLPVPAQAPVAEPRGDSSATAPVAEIAGHRVTAPTVGVFYRAPEPGAPPFVTEGDVVGAGQQVAIIEAMKLMIPVEADRAGRVVEVLVADGEPVEFGQPLVVLE
jgi:acetyl-CoA carboxylase biotin carboxyl carrier protein